MLDLILIEGIACEKGIDYYKSQPNFKTAWENCPRGDWMLWIAFKLKVNSRIFTLAKAYCARTVYHLMKDDVSKDAIIAAINYGRNLATEYELSDAADAAYAANAANATYAASAAATNAASAAATNTASSAVATYTASAASASAATNTASAAAKLKNQKKTADICRKYLTEEVFKILKIE